MKKQLLARTMLLAGVSLGCGNAMAVGEINDIHKRNIDKYLFAKKPLTISETVFVGDPLYPDGTVANRQCLSSEAGAADMIVGNYIANIKTSADSDHTDMLDEFNLNNDVKVSFGLFKGQDQFKLTKKVEKSSDQIVYTFYSIGKKTVSLKNLPELSELGKTKAQAPEEFKYACGTEYVNAIDMGAYVISNIAIKTDSATTTDELSNHLKTSYGSFADLTNDVQNLAKTNAMHVSISVDTAQYGLDAEKIANIYAKYGATDNLINCGVSNLSACKNIAESVLDYMTKDFKDQLTRISKAMSYEALQSAQAIMIGKPATRSMETIVDEDVGTPKEFSAEAQKLFDALNDYIKLQTSIEKLAELLPPGHRLVSEVSGLKDITDKNITILRGKVNLCFAEGFENCKADFSNLTPYPQESVKAMDFFAKLARVNIANPSDPSSSVSHWDGMSGDLNPAFHGYMLWDNAEKSLLISSQTAGAYTYKGAIYAQGDDKVLWGHNSDLRGMYFVHDGASLFSFGNRTFVLTRDSYTYTMSILDWDSPKIEQWDDLEKEMRNYNFVEYFGSSRKGDFRDFYPGVMKLHYYPLKSNVDLDNIKNITKKYK